MQFHAYPLHVTNVIGNFILAQKHILIAAMQDSCFFIWFRSCLCRLHILSKYPMCWGLSINTSRYCQNNCNFFLARCLLSSYLRLKSMILIGWKKYKHNPRPTSICLWSRDFVHVEVHDQNHVYLHVTWSRDDCSIKCPPDQMPLPGPNAPRREQNYPCVPFDCGDAQH